MDAPDDRTAVPLIRSDGVARALRHEVGDLLQSLYSTVALLQGRLPPEMELEKRLLTNLRGRAELCRLVLDAVVDLACPPALTVGLVDLSALARELAVGLPTQRPLSVEVSAHVPVVVRGDAERLRCAGKLLLENAVASAAQRVQLQVTALPSEAVWSIRDDGIPPGQEQLDWLTTPFVHTRRCLTGLGLALARQVAEAHGGSLRVVEGGCEVSLCLPFGNEINAG